MSFMVNLNEVFFIRFVAKHVIICITFLAFEITHRCRELIGYGTTNQRQKRELYSRMQPFGTNLK